MVDVAGLARSQRPRELGALLKIYAYVDRQAVRSHEIAAALHPLIGEYPAGVGWYDAFAAKELVAPLPDVDLSDVDEALKDLAAQGTDLPSLRHPQRLLAMAALLRVSGQSEKDHLEAGIVAALKPLMRGDPDEQIDAARVLFGRLGAADAGDLATLVTQSLDLFPATNALLWSETAPCDTGLITIPGTGSRTTVVLQTTLTTSPPPSLQDVELGYLHPEGWPQCCDFWCEMTRLTSGSPSRYKEVVGFDCTPGSSQRITTFLDFVWGKGPTGVYSLEYQLSDDQQNASGLIDVDEGSIVVEDLSITSSGNGLKITTTKRVRFKDLDSEHIALWACLFGYADAGRDMVRCTGHPLPAVPPTPNLPAPPKAKPAVGPGPSMVDDYFKALADCFAETANDYAVSFDKAMNGAYRPDDFTKDVARFWTRYLKDMRRLMPPPGSPPGAKE